LKIEPIYIPVELIETGDIILLSNSLLNIPMYSPTDNIRCCVIEKSKIYSTNVLTFVAEDAQIYRQEFSEMNVCLPLSSWPAKQFLYVFAKNIEVNDVLYIDDRYYTILSMQFIFSSNTSSHYAIVADSNSVIRQFNINLDDLVLVPITKISDKDKELLKERFPAAPESFDFNYKYKRYIFDRAFALETFELRECEFRLKQKCTCKAEFRFLEKYFCFSCLRKIAAIAVFSNRITLKSYNYSDAKSEEREIVF
jgi:hypothetical protein